MPALSLSVRGERDRLSRLSRRATGKFLAADDGDKNRDFYPCHPRLNASVLFKQLFERRETLLQLVDLFPKSFDFSGALVEFLDRRQTHTR